MKTILNYTEQNCTNVLFFTAIDIYTMVLLFTVSDVIAHPKPPLDPPPSNPKLLPSIKLELKRTTTKNSIPCTKTGDTDRRVQGI